MSILEQISEHGFRHLRGAVPNSEWTGIAKAAVWKSDNQYRYPNKDGSKGEYYRTQGIAQKLPASGTGFRPWRKTFKEKMEKNGYNTITYLTHPLKEGESHDMLCILEDFHCYDRGELYKTMDKIMESWDDYDRADDKEAQTLLLNSLESKFRQTIEADMDGNQCFITLFWKVVNRIELRSPKYYETLKGIILARRIKQYRNENVGEMVLDLRLDLEELEKANRDDPDMYEKILKALQEAGGNDRNYLIDLEAMQVKLRNRMKFAALKPKEQVIQECKDAGCHWTHILACARSAYDDLASNDQWLPAQKMHDKSALRSSYGANLVSGEVNPEANNLTQITGTFPQDKSKPKRDVSNDTCNKCGKKGHWARDCPQNKNKSGNNQRGNPGRSGNRNNRGSGGGGSKPPKSGDNPKKQRNPKKIRPKKGEPETKMFDGVLHKWCKPCGRFNTSHGTAEHRKKDGSGGPQANMAAAQEGAGGLAPDPQIWLGMLNFCRPCNEPVTVTFDEELAALPKLVKPKPETEPTLCSFCDMMGHDLSHCGTFQLSNCPVVEPSLPKACTWCHLYGHSKPNCANVHQRNPDTKKAEWQLQRHESIKASIKPHQTQAELNAITLIRRNQDVHRNWKHKLAVRELKAKREKDEWDSLPVLETLPKAQPPTPFYSSIPSMALNWMFKLWPLYLLLVATFWDEVVSMICQANMATVVSWAWNLLPKPDLTGLAEYAINQKLNVGFYSAQMFWKLQTLLVDGGCCKNGYLWFWIFGVASMFGFMLRQYLLATAVPPDESCSFSRREMRAKAKHDRKVAKREKKQATQARVHVKRRRVTNLYRHPLSHSRFRTPVLRSWELTSV